ncbi:cAMP-dependent protein kinase catalytic subunit [Tritrichomonas musculus]|uniref:cAMP-dependent protein kinase catalytic subunit n=1 Tax=Tritrichomonas musculus TaxID=1915356 RepID=A0ABR2GPA7_9EUKA
MNKDRLSNFENSENNESTEIELNNFNHIKLEDLGVGASTTVLICHLGLEQLLAMKIFYNIESEKLFEREKRNYEKIRHPLIPRFYGTGRIKNEKCLLIEYIKGISLDNIKQIKLNQEDKIVNIYELLKIIEYLHRNGFIYRDLKPDNFIIDENKTLVLIDFDRMLIQDSQQITKNFSSSYIAPEIFEAKRYSYEVDIFSLGLIVYFIIMEKEAPTNLYSRNIFDDFGGEFSEMKQIFENCINIEGSTRPTIDEIIHDFMKYYSSFIQNVLKYFNKTEINKNFNDSTLMIKKQESRLQEVIPPKNELMINQNDPEIQFNLGIIYLEGQNRAMGYLYYAGVHIVHNSKIAIRYFSLSAINGDTESHFILGVIYSQGIHIERNIQEAIHHYNYGSNIRDQYSKNNLGIIFKYYDYKKNPIEYFIESISQKEDPVSMYNLAHMYLYGKKANIDLDKSIELLIKSSKRGFYQSTILLVLALIKKISIQKITKEKIKEEMKKYINTNEINELLEEVIKQTNIDNFDCLISLINNFQSKINLTF